jgi:hypothetical protein
MVLRKAATVTHGDLNYPKRQNRRLDNRGYNQQTSTLRGFKLARHLIAARSSQLLATMQLIRQRYWHCNQNTNVKASHWANSVP